MATLEQKKRVKAAIEELYDSLIACDIRTNTEKDYTREFCSGATGSRYNLSITFKDYQTAGANPKYTTDNWLEVGL